MVATHRPDSESVSRRSPGAEPCDDVSSDRTDPFAYPDSGVNGKPRASGTSRVGDASDHAARVLTPASGVTSPVSLETTISLRGGVAPPSQASFVGQNRTPETVAIEGGPKRRIRVPRFIEG